MKLKKPSLKISIIYKMSIRNKNNKSIVLIDIFPFKNSNHHLLKTFSSYEN